MIDLLGRTELQLQVAFSKQSHSTQVRPAAREKTPTEMDALALFGNFGFLCASVSPWWVFCRRKTDADWETSNVRCFVDLPIPPP